MYSEIVTLTVMIGCIPCILHCWMVRGRWETIGFFTGGFVFGIVRENIVALMPQLYTYPGHAIYIGAAPLMMGFGWSASFYASWSISERLLEGFLPSRKDSSGVVPLLTALITGLLSIPVEVTAVAPETSWWVWPPDAITILWEMPALVPFGWAGAAFLFVLFFGFIMNRNANKQQNALIFVSATLLIIAIHLVYVLFVRTIIVAIAGA